MGRQLSKCLPLLCQKQQPPICNGSPANLTTWLHPCRVVFYSVFLHLHLCWYHGDGGSAFRGLQLHLWHADVSVTAGNCESPSSPASWRYFRALLKGRFNQTWKHTSEFHTSVALLGWGFYSKGCKPPQANLQRQLLLHRHPRTVIDPIRPLHS